MTGLELYDAATGSAARRLLFRDTLGRETTSEVVRWWESRRLAYNIAVGATGVLSLAFLFGLGAVGPLTRADLGPPFVAVVGFAILANVAYTSGWLLELLLLRPIFGTRAGTVAATLFRYGLAFSVGITALPIGVALFDFGVRVVRWMFGAS